MTTPLQVVMSSSQLAKVEELPAAIRRFKVGSEDGYTTTVTYTVASDKLFCHRHGEYDNCSETSRVRLCGILSGHVIPDVKHWKRAAR